jgi:hypothetical protein
LIYFILVRNFGLEIFSFEFFRGSCSPDEISNERKELMELVSEIEKGFEEQSLLGLCPEIPATDFEPHLQVRGPYFLRGFTLWKHFNWFVRCCPQSIGPGTGTNRQHTL